MNTLNDKQIHQTTLEQRKHMDVSGVKEVVSFDDSLVVLKTLCGEMSVEGKDMKIGVLDIERGVVVLEGTIDAIYYSRDEDDKKHGIFGKLLR